MKERKEFEAWMKQRGTPLEIEHPQAFDAWCAAKAQEREACATVAKEWMAENIAEAILMRSTL